MHARRWLAIALSSLTALFGLCTIASALLLAMIPSTVEHGKQVDHAFLAASAYVEGFIKEHRRAPSREEYGQWALSQRSNARYAISISVVKPSELPDDLLAEHPAPSDAPFALTMWRGDWEESYAPWADASTVDSPMSLYAMGIGAALLCCLLTMFSWKATAWAKKSRPLTMGFKPTSQ